MENVNNTLKEQRENEILEGYNPKVYRRLSIIFIILTILNVAIIISTFSKIGYGLWHAENALSYIAKIDSNFENINQSVLKMELHSDDNSLVLANIENIGTSYKEIADNASKFREIDISSVDKTLSDDFEASMRSVNNYYNIISGNLDGIKNGTIEISILRDSETETMRESAAASLRNLFNKSDESTYAFFYRVAQRFLIVVLSLILTMSAGLFAISRSKKRDKAFADKLQSSEEKRESYAKKARYTSIVTGLNNRYALFKQLNETVGSEKDEDLMIALYSFSNFRDIYKDHGREYTDEFMASISESLVEKFGDFADFYSTDTDELCAVFKPKFIDGSGAVAQNILEFLSLPVKTYDIQLQLIVAGCICYCSKNAYKKVDDLFIAIDYNMDQIKNESLNQNKSMIKYI